MTPTRYMPTLAIGSWWTTGSPHSVFKVIHEPVFREDEWWVPILWLDNDALTVRVVEFNDLYTPCDAPGGVA